MALFNYASKEITLKVVYYGPGLSGKTTNLQRLHASMTPERKGKLLSLSTEADRTLFFDFLPVALGKIKEFNIRFQLYTVPGQVRYNATRKLVLKGADAVVFVADSQKAMKDQNIESFRNMRENLVSNNINPDEIPVVLQYNKRDLKTILSIEELNADLNPGDYPITEASAVTGLGVDDTFKLITRLLLKYISKKHNVQIEAPEEAPQEHEFTPTSHQTKETVSLVSPTKEEDSFPAFAAEIPQTQQPSWPGMGAATVSEAPAPPPAREDISWQDLMETTSHDQTSHETAAAHPSILDAPMPEPEETFSFTDMMEPAGGFDAPTEASEAEEISFDATIEEEPEAWPSPGLASSYLDEGAIAAPIDEPLKPTSPFDDLMPAFEPDITPEPQTVPASELDIAYESTPEPTEAQEDFSMPSSAELHHDAISVDEPQIVNVPVLSEENMERIIQSISAVTSAVRDMVESQSNLPAAPQSDENLVLAVRSSADVNARLMTKVLEELQESRKRQDVMLELLKRSEHALRAIASTVLEAKEEAKEKEKKGGFKLFGR